jgi:hypothetical protein
VPSVDELDRILDDIAARYRPNHPTIVELSIPPMQVGFGLGAPESFVQLQWSNDPPYRITMGDERAGGVVAFYLFGHHHTEVSRRNLLPASTVRQLVRDIYRTGEQPPTVRWEDV